MPLCYLAQSEEEKRYKRLPSCWLKAAQHRHSRPRRRCRRVQRCPRHWTLYTAAMDALFGSSRQEPKPGAEAAAGDEKDEPASEYRRLERFVVAWLVGDNAIFTFAALSKRMIRYNAMAIEIMVFPISMSLCLLLAFGTLQSLRVGPRAIAVWFLFWFCQAVISVPFSLSDDPSIIGAIGGFLWHAFVAVAFGWLIAVLRSELRALGSLDIVTPRITGRLSEIIGIQAALALIDVRVLDHIIVGQGAPFSFAESGLL